MKVFISLTEHDADAFNALAAKLRDQNFEIITSRDIPIGDRRRLDEAILWCDAVIFIMTEAFRESEDSKHLVQFSVEHRKEIRPLIVGDPAKVVVPTEVSTNFSPTVLDPSEIVTFIQAMEPEGEPATSNQDATGGAPPPNNGVTAENLLARMRSSIATGQVTSISEVTPSEPLSRIAISHLNKYWAQLALLGLGITVFYFWDRYFSRRLSNWLISLFSLSNFTAVGNGQQRPDSVVEASVFAPPTVTRNRYLHSVRALLLTPAS